MAFDIWCDIRYVDKTKQQYDLGKKDEDMEENTLVCQLVANLLKDTTLEASATNTRLPLRLQQKTENAETNNLTSLKNSSSTAKYKSPIPSSSSSSFFSDNYVPRARPFALENWDGNLNLASNSSASSSNHSPFSTGLSPTLDIYDDNFVNFDFQNENNPLYFQTTSNDCVDTEEQHSNSLDFQDNGCTTEIEEQPETYSIELLRMAAETARRHEGSGSPNTQSDNIANNFQNNRTLTIDYLDLTMDMSSMSHENNAHQYQNIARFYNQPFPVFNNRPREPIVNNSSDNPNMFHVDPRILSMPPPATVIHDADFVCGRQPIVHPDNRYIHNEMSHPVANMNLNGFNQLPIQKLGPIVPGLNRSYVKNDTPSYSLLQRNHFSQNNGFYNAHTQGQVPILPMPGIMLEYPGLRGGPQCANTMPMSALPPPSRINTRDSMGVPMIMSDLFVHLNHRTMRKDDPSSILQVYLEICYEQWRLLEIERKKTEADLAITFPGKMMSSVSSAPVPRTTASRTKIDRLIVDMLREYSKVVTLMSKMEQLRTAFKKNHESKDKEFSGDKNNNSTETSCSNLNGVNSVTVLKRGELLGDSKEDINKDSLRNIVKATTFPDVDPDIVAWKSAIDTVKTTRDKEAMWFKDTDMAALITRLSVSKNVTPDEKKMLEAYYRQKSCILTMLATNVKTLAHSSRRARLTMWCNLTLTKAIAKEEKPSKPVKKSKYVFAALEKYKQSLKAQSFNKEKSVETTAVTAESKNTKPDVKPANNDTPSTGEKKNLSTPKTVASQSGGTTSGSSASSSGSSNNKSQQNNKSSSSNHSSSNHQRISPKRGYQPMMFPYNSNSLLYHPTVMPYFHYDHNRFAQPFNTNYRFGHRLSNNGGRGKDYQKQPNHNNNYLSAAPIK